MSATILVFPASPDRLAGHRPAPAISASGLATKFNDHFLPIAQASVDLLEADEADFEARCLRMLDGNGTAMIDQLCAELQIVGRQMQVLVDGLELTRGRLRTAIARLAPSAATPDQR